ncbi:MAG TPA: NAD(+) synthase [Candidatus Dorea intestinavium]|nr:NAD(+) synthase [Candidatus Dorea intestinavium]
MKDGFVKVASIAPDLRVADVTYNVEMIIKGMKEAAKEKVKLIVFPELSITSYTCGDLFNQDDLLNKAKDGLFKIARASKDIDALVFVGLPFEVAGKLYNVAAALNKGKILGLTTKTFLPNYGEFYEMRQFVKGPDNYEMIELGEETIPFGKELLYKAKGMESFVVGAEICEDLWSVVPPSIEEAIEGATIIVNLSASNETIGKAEYRKALVASQSASILGGYVYASAGIGESTTDMVFAGHNLIAENGIILKESPLFTNNMQITEIDTKRLLAERRKNTTFVRERKRVLPVIPFEVVIEETKLSRVFDEHPYLPADEATKTRRCEEILTMQAMGLRKRLEHTKSRTAIVGISGGLDSTLALLVTKRAFEYLKKDNKDIIAVTMPSFGTTDRTYENACNMVRQMGATLREIPIAQSVRLHFKEIGHDEKIQDVTYENAQARERTQVLMDIANKENGLVIGTGDMSELALGWATYNGDHMSMYAVNSSIPKTLVRLLVKHSANTTEDLTLKKILLDVVDTPVSPELLPPKEGEIAQKTEDLVGPYELHDFFLYYMLRFDYAKDKIKRVAIEAFKGDYSEETIEKWLEIFMRRFYSQQYKRSCMPDGPKVGSVGLSPRGDLRMPSDAIYN